MGLLERIFKRQTTPARAYSVEINEQSTFTAWGGNAWENDIYRGAVDAIARNAGKLKGSHVIQYADDQRKTGDFKINRLLQVRPNPYMTAYDFLYKMVARYFLYNNSFALIERDDNGNPRAFYPITASNVQFMTDGANRLYCGFTLNNGAVATFPYEDVIHLRRAFCGNDLLGDDNGALYPALELAQTQNEGIIKGIKSGANIRGILHFTGIIAPEQLKEEKDRFVNDYFSMNNDGGVVVTDQKTEYTPIESKPVILSAEQSQAVKTKIYDYLGVSENIVNSSYNENEFAAFYESTIEPIALALGLEFTQKLFTDREQALGNSILFESGRLQFTSNATKVQLIKELMPMGLLTVNQALEILNLPGVADGDKRITSLNYIDESIAAEYQLQGIKSTQSNKGVQSGEGAQA